MGFASQEYWSRLPCASPGDLPNPGIEPLSLMSPRLLHRQMGSFPLALVIVGGVKYRSSFILVFFFLVWDIKQSQQHLLKRLFIISSGIILTSLLKID